MKDKLLSILAGAALLGGGVGNEVRITGSAPKKQFPRKVWMKKAKRVRMQKQSRKINRVA